MAQINTDKILSFEFLVKVFVTFVRNRRVNHIGHGEQ